MVLRVFFSNATATTEIYTLSLHDALPICHGHALPSLIVTAAMASGDLLQLPVHAGGLGIVNLDAGQRDRKSTRLNSSHEWISYAVFCLKKKKKDKQIARIRNKNTQKQQII